MPLFLSLGFPVACMIGGFVLLSEELYRYGWEDWLDWLIIPLTLFTFFIGCALNLLVVPIGLLVAPPTFFIVVIGDELKRRKRV